ncbi:MAG: hypothetical protein LBL52_02780 [Rickettsiales bacterium]|jgi:hypothetical protein|nr:hypothetical protein [Rickettsiales bacterium]
MKKLLLFMLLFAFDAWAAACDKPALYGLTTEEANGAPQLYCWEIKWAKEHLGRASASEAEVLAAYPTPLFVRDPNLLRARGITPEKAEYLMKFFIDYDSAGNVNRGLFNSNIFDRRARRGVLSTDESLLNAAVNKAKNEMRSNFSEYKVENLDAILWNHDAYYTWLILNRVGCLDIFSTLNKFKDYPKALWPAAVVGRHFVNAFGEVVGKIGGDDKLGLFGFNGDYHPVTINGSDAPIAQWDSSMCNIRDPSLSAKRPLSCLPCFAFELAFNTVSRIGYVMYDELSRYALGVMCLGFLIWMLFVFFNNVVKDGQPFEFVKTFFTKVIWVFIISAVLSVSITDKDNIINYAFRPLTDLMRAFSDTMTVGIDGGKPWECRYKEVKAIQDNAVLFDREVKMNIVCSIERIADFTNMNFNIGKYAALQGWRQFSNLAFGDAFLPGTIVIVLLAALAIGLGIFTKASVLEMVAMAGLAVLLLPLALAPKIALGILIMGLYFYMGLLIPFYFIESIFQMAVVVFLAPLLLAGYAIDKTAGFAKQGFATFMGAIFQIISLSIMCAVIALLMNLASGLDPAEYYHAMTSGDDQAIASQTIRLLAMNTNDLLQIGYTWLVCWYLLSSAMNMAAKAFPMSQPFNGDMPKKFFKWTQNAVKYSASVMRDQVFIKRNAKMAARALQEQRALEANAAAKNSPPPAAATDSGDGAPATEAPEGEAPEEEETEAPAAPPPVEEDAGEEEAAAEEEAEETPAARGPSAEEVEAQRLYDAAVREAEEARQKWQAEEEAKLVAQGTANMHLRMSEAAQKEADERRRAAALESSPGTKADFEALAEKAAGQAKFHERKSIEAGDVAQRHLRAALKLKREYERLKAAEDKAKKALEEAKNG